MDKGEGNCPRQVAHHEGRHQEVDGIEPDPGKANHLLFLHSFQGFICLLLL